MLFFAERLVPTDEVCSSGRTCPPGAAAHEIKKSQVRPEAFPQPSVYSFGGSRRALYLLVKYVLYYLIRRTTRRSPRLTSEAGEARQPSP